MAMCRVVDNLFNNSLTFQLKSIGGTAFDFYYAKLDINDKC